MPSGLKLGLSGRARLANDDRLAVVRGEFVAELALAKVTHALHLSHTLRRAGAVANVLADFAARAKEEASGAQLFERREVEVGAHGHGSEPGRLALVARECLRRESV